MFWQLNPLKIKVFGMNDARKKHAQNIQSQNAKIRERVAGVSPQPSFNDNSPLLEKLVDLLNEQKKASDEQKKANELLVAEIKKMAQENTALQEAQIEILEKQSETLEKKSFQVVAADINSIAEASNEEEIFIPNISSNSVNEVKRDLKIESSQLNNGDLDEAAKSLKELKKRNKNKNS